MTVATLGDLSVALAKSMTWRIREISDLKQVVRRSPETLQYATIRASIPILYAHWEGHTRVCAVTFAQYVAARRLRYSDLGRGFMLGALRGHIDRATHSRAKQVQIALIDRVEELLETSFRGGAEKLVETRSNLSYEVLTEIGQVLGLDMSGLDHEATFIDKVLLDRRNNIAHGADISLDANELEGLIDRTIGLMRSVHNIVENSAVSESYKRAPALPA